MACHNSRGQQGIGISASVLYSQLTTGRLAKIKSKISTGHQAYYMELGIDTAKNKPQTKNIAEIDWDKDHGTRIEMDIEASYLGGSQSIDEYLKETAIANPHATIIYTNPKAEQIIFPRVVDKTPKEPKEIKPHPYGVELGMMMRMLQNTISKTLQAFLTQEFTRVGAGTAKLICENAALLPNTKPKSMSREMSENLMRGIKETKLIAPPMDCISPIKAEALEKGMRKEINAEFYATITRPPAVYRGNPFVIEAGIAYGGDQPADKAIKVLRLANRVPLLFQQGACAVTKALTSTAWRNYGLSQSKNSLPVGPLTVVIHIASVWVPFTSESKEAIAHYPEIIKEVKLAIQEVGRKLASYVHKKKKILAESKKRSHITTFMPMIADTLKDILTLKDEDKQKIEGNLAIILEATRGELEDMKFDPTKNVDYDKEFAAIGKEDQSREEEKDEDENKSGKSGEKADENKSGRSEEKKDENNSIRSEDKSDEDKSDEDKSDEDKSDEDKSDEDKSDKSGEKADENNPEDKKQEHKEETTGGDK
ncbi:MAG: DNA topoisomerase VI subunit B [Nanoarchaeota archaeon]|nr:DNA topoisomerase VI subunit B [Nanoarchaeota archaeon]